MTGSSAGVAAGAAAEPTSRGCVEPAPRARRRGRAVPNPRPAPAGATGAVAPLCGPWDGPSEAACAAEPEASSALADAPAPSALTAATVGAGGCCAALLSPPALGVLIATGEACSAGSEDGPDTGAAIAVVAGAPAAPDGGVGVGVCRSTQPPAGKLPLRPTARVAASSSAGVTPCAAAIAVTFCPVDSPGQTACRQTVLLPC